MKKIISAVTLITFACLLAAASALASPATVQSLTPGAWAKANGQNIALELGSALEEHYTMQTDSTGQVQMRFIDGTEVVMGPHTSAQLSEFVFYEGETPAFNMNLTAGTARFVTGAVVKQNPEGFQVTTPLGTVGVRGTKFAIIVTNDKVTIVVIEMSPGHSVLVTGQDGKTVTITQAGTKVDLVRGQPTPPSAQPASEDEMAVLPVPGEEGEGSANLPHRDVGEQMMAAVEIQMGSATNSNPSPNPNPPPPPPPPRTTYPAFLLGLPAAPAGTVSVDSIAMSKDGSRVLTAYKTGGQMHYTLWKSDGSNTTLEVEDIGTNGSWAMSGDGKFAYHVYQDVLDPNGSNYKVRNLDTNALYPLTRPDPANQTRELQAFNNNGSIGVGYYDDSVIMGLCVARWNYNAGTGTFDPYTPLDSLSNPFPGRAYAVSDDGSVIVGRTESTYSPTIWTQTSGTTYSALPLSTPSSGNLNAITPGGEWAAGYATNGSGYDQALRAQSKGAGAGAYQFLPLLSGDISSYAMAISNDGQVLAGESRDMISNYRAFFWTPTLGSVDVNSHLTAYGINLGSISLTRAPAISGDGSILLCLDTNTNTTYLVRIDGDYLGITTPSNVYASLAGIAAGSTQLAAANQISAAIPGLSGVAVGYVPAAGDVQGGNVLRVWGSGAFMSNYAMNKDDTGAMGAVGATYFMDNGLSFGLSGMYGYRAVYGDFNSKQTLDSMTLGLSAGYAPEVTGIRLSLGAMMQDYKLNTVRNYQNGADAVSSSGNGRGWGFGFVGHAGWVFGLTETFTIQPFAEYTWQQTETPDYQEDSGPFPAKYDSQKFTQNITRLGLDIQWDITPTFNIQSWLAWNHRFESEGPASTGAVIGWQPFYFAGSELKQNWGDTGLGFRWRFLDNTTLGARLGFGIDNKNSGLPDMMGSISISVDI